MVRGFDTEQFPKQSADIVNLASFRRKRLKAGRPLAPANIVADKGWYHQAAIDEIASPKPPQKQS